MASTQCLKRLKNLPQIKVGLALSDAGVYYRDDRKIPEDLAIFFQAYQSKLDTQGLFIEFQPEAPWIKQEAGSQYAVDENNSWLKLGKAFKGEETNSAYAEVIEALRNPDNIFGVHQSIADMDVLSKDLHKRLVTIESTQQAMLFAQLISADYFVFHLAQSKDYWDWNRGEQISIALRAFQELAGFYKSSGFTFTPLLENLEFPKFPATAEEMVSMFNTCRELLPNLRLCFDLSHLWHSRILLLENRNKFRRQIPNFSLLEASFDDYLDYTMEELFIEEGVSGEDIFLFHLGGCWGHLTHEIPGLRPEESPFVQKLRLDEPVYSYDPQIEMNLKNVLTKILRYSLENRRNLLLMLEIHKKDYSEMLEAGKLLQADLTKKTDRIMAKVCKYAYLWE
jgi:hypothetical protein